MCINNLVFLNIQLHDGIKGHRLASQACIVGALGGFGGTLHFNMNKLPETTFLGAVNLHIAPVISGNMPNGLKVNGSSLTANGSNIWKIYVNMNVTTIANFPAGTTCTYEFKGSYKGPAPIIA